MNRFIDIIALVLIAGAIFPFASLAQSSDPATAGKPATSPAPTIARNPTGAFKPEALWDGRKIVPFHAIDNPPMVAAKDADFIGDDEYVLGATVGSEYRAYPTRFVWWHHFVNDTAKDGTPLAVSYCSVCNTGIAFLPKLEGKRINIDFYGLYNGVACFMERESESVFLQVNGTFVTGPLAGKTLKMEPLLDTTWGRWRSLHPATLVMSPDSQYKKAYAPKGTAEPRGYTRFPNPFFRTSVTHTDTRLPAFDKVVAVTAPSGRLEQHRAYPMQDLARAGGVVNDIVGDTPVVVLVETDTATATVLNRTVDGRTLTFEWHMGDGQRSLYDRETGTRWGIEGLAESGKLRGKHLTPVTNHLSQWYGWVAYYPDTTIWNRTDPPQTGPNLPDPVVDPFVPRRVSGP